MEPAANTLDQALTIEDRASIIQASRDYVEGWYEADPERMARALADCKRYLGVERRGFGTLMCLTGETNATLH